jgi:hypothetical protein
MNMKKLLIIISFFIIQKGYSQNISIPRDIFEYHFEQSQEYQLVKKQLIIKDSLIFTATNTIGNLNEKINTYKIDADAYTQINNNNNAVINILKKDNKDLEKENKLLKIVNKLSGGSTLIAAIIIVVILL